MAFSLALPKRWSAQGWKAKIRDRERLEPPHVTITRGAKSWRVGLRDGRFLDGEPDPREVPSGVVEAVTGHWARLCEEWDALYPANPVGAEDDTDD
jgi:hypothetical protein